MRMKELRKYNSQKGISLITLIITIIVVIILAGVVIFSLINNNPIEVANEAVFKNDLDSFRSELQMYNLGEYAKNPSYNKNSLEVGVDEIGEIINTLKDNKKYEGKLKIESGELIFICNKTKEDNWAEEIGIRVVCQDVETEISLPSEPIVNSNTDVEYEITFSSSYEINQINLDGNIELLTLDGQIVGTDKIRMVEITGDENSLIRRVTVMVDTSELEDGEYKIKVKENTVKNRANVWNNEVISYTFEVNNVAPLPPNMTANPTTWTNQNVEVTIAYSEENSKKEYSLDGGDTWIEYSLPITVTENMIIIAKETNILGTESIASILEITNIDRIVPQGATISVSGNENGISGTITLIDNESGINVSDSKYMISVQSTPYEINDVIWGTATTLNSNPQNISVSKPYGYFYLHILLIDKAENKKTVVSNRIAVSKDGIMDTGYNEEQGLNGPVLKVGMVPIKWNQSGNVIATTLDDPEWYNYPQKKWANVQSEDGSMWVWIPRYEYKIPAPHTSTAQTVDIKFMNRTSTTASSGYTISPAFTFGSTELKGIWIAKFEASGTTNSIDIKPGTTSLRNITMNDAFTVCKNMERNSKYGWGIDGSGIDTHLIKNVEWGAVAYLSSSVYGKIGEVWINPNSNYITGQAGTSVNADSTISTYAYNNTQYGINASTSGTVNGVYDMSGGLWEYTASYVNNGNSSLTTYGASLVNAEAKYKDVYSKGADDDRRTNYLANSSKKGDAIYETSTNGGDDNPTSSWYSDFSYMPYSTGPFFMRGGVYADASSAGIFAFEIFDGNIAYYRGFRPVVLADLGL